MMAARHEQVDARVNVPVDRGVAPLVEALSAFEGVYTVDSCECDDRSNAYVAFVYGEDWEEAGGFLSKLSEELTHYLPRDCFFTLALEWAASGSAPLARLVVSARNRDELAGALLKAASRQS